MFQSDAQKSIFDTIDRTITKIGRDFLKNIIRNPLTQIPQLEQRKATIKYLIENQDLSDQIKHELYSFSKNELSVSTLWEPHDSLCKTTLDDFYYENSYLKKYNSSSAALNFLQVANVGNMFAPLIEHLALHFFISNTLAEKLHIGCAHHHHDPGNDHHHRGTFSSILYNMYNVTHFALHMFGVKQLYDVIKQKAAIAKTVQANLIAANRCLKSLKNIYKATRKRKGKLQDLTHLHDLEAFFESQENQELISLLEKNTFQGSPSLLSNIGNILAAYTQIQQSSSFRAADACFGRN